MEPLQIISLIDEYNSDPRRFNDAEAEVIAQLSKAMGQNFRRESKPFSKALYGAADMATFGLLPESFLNQGLEEKLFMDKQE